MQKKPQTKTIQKSKPQLQKMVAEPANLDDVTQLLSIVRFIYLAILEQKKQTNKKVWNILLVLQLYCSQTFLVHLLYWPTIQNITL